MRLFVSKLVVCLSCVSLVACTSLATYPNASQDLRDLGVAKDDTITVQLRTGQSKVLYLTAVEAKRLSGIEEQSKQELVVNDRDIKGIEKRDVGKTWLLVGVIVLAVLGAGMAAAHKTASAFNGLAHP